MAYDVKILADSVSPAGHRLTTFQVTFPRIVLAEVNTHRMLARNSASSRAIPVEKRVVAVENDPFVPEQFGKNQKGMQADVALEQHEAVKARDTWLDAKDSAIEQAKRLAMLGVHKQLANRLLEPFAWHTAILTATDWSNFFNLRCHKDAQPEFSKAAHMMRDLYEDGKPRELKVGQWHLPFIRDEDDGPYVNDRDIDSVDWERWCRISVARCARVSYLTQDGRRDHEEDLKLFDRLVGSAHLSPLEHSARPMTVEELELFRRRRFVWDAEKGWRPVELVRYSGAFNGWVSRRALVAGEHDIMASQVE
jgi:thymidylate synthase ThyX